MPDNRPSKDRVASYMKKLPSLRAWVLGDVMLDRYFWGVVDRISPEAPVPVVKVTRRSARLGGAANVAANLRSLGLQVSLLGTVGHDPAGQEVQNLLSARGIDATGLVVGDDRATTEKVRIIAQSQQVVRADFEEPSPISESIEDFLMSTLEQGINDCDVLIVSDYGKGVIQEGYLKKAIRLWRDRGKWLLIDPHVGHFHWYKGAGLITPNTKEAASRYGQPVDGDETISQLGSRLMSDLDLTALLITRGEAGMSLFYEGDREFHVPTVAKEVYDVTGAGDTVISVLGALLGAGAPLVDSVVIANQAAGEVVKEVGTSVISSEIVVSSFI